MPAPAPHSLRREILGTLLGGAAILSFLAFLLVEWGFRTSLSQSRGSVLRAAVHEASLVRPDLRPGAVVPAMGLVQWRILSPAGEPIALSHRFEAVPREAWPGLGAPPTLDASGTWLRVESPLEAPAQGSIQLALDLRPERFVLVRHTYLRLAMVGFTFLAAWLVGEVIVRLSIRPLGGLAMQAALIRPKELGRRIPLEAFPLELRDLVASMNIGMERLQDAFQRLEHLGTDLAHELRSPIQNLRSELEGLLLRPRGPLEQQEVLGSCLEELDRLSQMIEQMLFLARCEEPSSELRLGPLPVVELLEGMAAYFEVSADAAEVTLAVEGQRELAVMADRSLLQRALSNLVSNAIRHTPPGGHITLRALGGPQGEVYLEVADTGEGIPAELLHTLGNRFTRVEHSRSRSRGGTGLGLAIVRGIMRLHGGDLELASELGKGTRARLTFPADPTGRTRRRASGAHVVVRS